MNVDRLTEMPTGAHRSRHSWQIFGRLFPISVLKGQPISSPTVMWMCEGTHTGPAFYDLVMGALPDASDRKMRFSGMSAIRLKAGKIIEENGLADGVTALNQLSFIHAPVWPA